MAAPLKHDWTTIFATLRADGWGPTSEGGTSLRKHAASAEIPIGTFVAKMRTERARPGGGLLAEPVRQVDPDEE